MSSNAQKTWFNSTQNQFARKKVGDAIQKLGKALQVQVVSIDASGTIVTVSFNVNAAPFTLPQVTIPVFGPEFIRYPIQVGANGVVFPVDVRIGGITGLGSGIPNLVAPANLSALVFFPVGNKNFTATDDPDKLVLYGPDGVIVRDAGKNCTVTVDSEQITIVGKTTVTLKVGANTVTVTSGGIDIEGTLTINGQPYLAHEHSGVQTGSGNTGAVVP